MARTEPQINLRIPADLKDAIDASAAENRRSVTAEVVARLQGSFDPYTANPDMSLLAAKLNRDSAVATVEAYRLRARLGEFASTIMLWANKLFHGGTIDRAELDEWFDAARGEYEISQRLTQQHTNDALSVLVEAQRALNEVIALSAREARTAGHDGPPELSDKTGGKWLGGWTLNQGDWPAIPDDPDELLRLADQRIQEAERLRDVHRSYTARKAAHAAIDEIEKGSGAGHSTH